KPSLGRRMWRPRRRDRGREKEAAPRSGSSWTSCASLVVPVRFRLAPAYANITPPDAASSVTKYPCNETRGRVISRPNRCRVGGQRAPFRSRSPIEQESSRSIDRRRLVEGRWHARPSGPWARTLGAMRTAGDALANLEVENDFGCKSRILRL